TVPVDVEVALGVLVLVASGDRELVAPGRHVDLVVRRRRVRLVDGRTQRAVAVGVGADSRAGAARVGIGLVVGAVYVEDGRVRGSREPEREQQSAHDSGNASPSG